MMNYLSLILFFIALNAYSSEEFPAGSGTTSDFSVQAFSHPMSGTSSKDRRDFTVGNSFFQTTWVSSPASTPLRDGLGPNFNAVSCTSCHFKDGRGRGLPDADGKTDMSLLLRLRVKGENNTTTLHPNYGGQFNPFGVAGVPGEGESHVYFETITGEFQDGEKFELKKPIYYFKNLNFGEMGENTILSPRVGPQMIGLGLLENINESDILANADEQAKSGDGISGRVNRVYSLVTGSFAIGRFGWKAGKASLLEQNAAAYNGDIGITSYLFPDEECTYVQTDCQRFKTPDDISPELLEKVTTYTKLLAVPKRRDFGTPQVLRGEKVFKAINCIACHTASYTTGNNSNLDVLNNQKIYPYTDLLVHDMGDDLADDKGNHVNEEGATTREWRTPPLWGLGLVKIVNTHTRLMHDGRARNFSEAILWHGGEGQKSKEAYLKLSKADRDSLIEFLGSL